MKKAPLIFFRGKIWADTAFVAEKILSYAYGTTEQLQADKH
ncbi:hypothetical protein [Ancylothrix sp. D3o]|nr:hypothetical protein [Ancylothrix sp. D3o]